MLQYFRPTPTEDCAVKIELEELRTKLIKDGPRASLVYLNNLTEHRFTAMYRFDRDVQEGDILHALFFYDRENPEANESEDVPIMAAYCMFVRDRCEPFVTENSLGDTRTTGHPKRREIRSYCGVPLLTGDGQMLGTVCHFDFEPRVVSEECITLMQALAGMLQEQDRLAAG